MAKPRKNGKGRKRSKSEASTGAKENAAEMRKGELSLGEPVVIDSSTFHFHLKAIKSATERKDTANNLLRGCYKAAKQVNEHLGDKIKKVIELERSNDPAKFKAELEVLGIALKETGSPIQLTIHDTLMGDQDELAYKRGKDAGGNGKPCASPYPKGTSLDEQWCTGWRNAVGGTLGLSEQETEEAVSGAVEDPALREHALN